MKKKSNILFGLLCSLLLFSACGKEKEEQTPQPPIQTENSIETENSTETKKEPEVDLEALFGTGKTTDETKKEENRAVSVQWTDLEPVVIDDHYRNYYEIFVYSFSDSDGDGIGDLQGVIEKLDYLNDADPKTTEDLGITGIWLMPIMPSDTYHKYDVKDYREIDESYGTLEDFEQLLSECHNRGINVIIDFVFNHTSSKHEWFIKACDYLKNLPSDKTPDVSECPYFDYYHFTKESQGGYAKLEGTDWYYEARFYSEMPDLNLESEAVRKEIEDIAAFWIDLGVDGFRLDAVKEFETGNTQANTEILRWFNAYTKSLRPDFYLVCECWTEESTYSKYYDSQVDSMFDFQFADKNGLISNAVNGTIQALSLAETLVAEQETFAAHNPNYINAPFYSNHDMGRSAGYYKGENSLYQTKMGHAVNLLTTGNAFLYYGEELGMKGSGKDENKRAPMYWSKDPTQSNMCKGPENMDAFAMKYDSLEEQKEDESSIYTYIRHVLQVRNHYPAIARGKTELIEDLSGETCCALSKTYDEEKLILLYNFGSEKTQIDLSDHSFFEAQVTSADLTILADLSTNENAVYDNGTLTIPAYSVTILGPTP